MGWLNAIGATHTQFCKYKFPLCRGWQNNIHIHISSLVAINKAKSKHLCTQPHGKQTQRKKIFANNFQMNKNVLYMYVHGADILKVCCILLDPGHSFIILDISKARKAVIFYIVILYGRRHTQQHWVSTRLYIMSNVECAWDDDDERNESHSVERSHRRSANYSRIICN